MYRQYRLQSHRQEAGVIAVNAAKMLVLFETAAGFAIFKLLDEKKLKSSVNLYKDFETPEAANNVLKLKQFHKFEDTTEALAAATAAVEGKMSKGLKKMLKKLFVKEAHEELAVADAKLGNCIKEKLKIQCVSNPAIQELMRCIRAQTDSLISGLPRKELTAMALGLAHSLSRYKLKFSPDKVDTMIVQAVSLLDDLDKELNNYTMRCHEWYGWHFPELGKIVTDNSLFVRTVKLLGVRSNASTCDFSSVLPEEMEANVKEAAEISMGTEISEEDILNITFLCDQIIEMTQYREQLYSYLRNRMMAIAPNVTTLVGELIGARLISHAGSLINLAKHPASTVQILGAEKALFRALKAKSQTPKYGLLYHAQMVAQASTKLKGKVSRMLATKTSLACRVDALGEDITCEMGIEHKALLEKRVKMLEDGVMRRLSGTGKQQKRFDKYEGKSEVRQYPVSKDSTLSKWGKETPKTSGAEETPAGKGVKRKLAGDLTPGKKAKKKKKSLGESSITEPGLTEAQTESPKASTSGTPGTKKGKKKKKLQQPKEEQDEPVVTKPKKKKASEEGTFKTPTKVKSELQEETEGVPEKKKKKKKDKS